MNAKQSLITLNQAAYAAIKAVKADPHNDIDTARLFAVAHSTDALVDALKPESHK